MNDEKLQQQVQQKQQQQRQIYRQQPRRPEMQTAASLHDTTANSLFLNLLA